MHVARRRLVEWLRQTSTCLAIVAKCQGRRKFRHDVAPSKPCRHLVVVVALEYIVRVRSHRRLTGARQRVGLHPRFCHKRRPSDAVEADGVCTE